MQKLPVLTPSRKIDDLLFDVSYFNNDTDAIAPHQHDCIEMTFIQAGTAAHVTGGARQKAYAGTVFILPIGSDHAFEDIRELELYNVSCSPDILDSFGVDLTFLRRNESALRGKPESSVFQLEVMEQYNLRKLLSEMYAEYCHPGPQCQVKLRSLFTLLLVMLARTGERKKDNAPERMTQVEMFIQAHFNEKITLSRLAAVACRSESQLIRAFRSKFGATPVDYLLKVRLEHAGKLLTESDMTVSEVAANTGFTDSNYFIKQFRRRYGVSPGRFRR